MTEQLGADISVNRVDRKQPGRPKGRVPGSLRSASESMQHERGDRDGYSHEQIRRYQIRVRLGERFPSLRNVSWATLLECWRLLKDLPEHEWGAVVGRFRRQVRKLAAAQKGIEKARRAAKRRALDEPAAPETVEVDR